MGIALIKEYAHLAQLKAQLAVIVALDQEHADSIANGAFGAYAQDKGLAHLAQLYHVVIAEHKHAHLLVLGAHVLVKVLAALAQLK